MFYLSNEPSILCLTVLLNVKSLFSRYIFVKYVCAFVMNKHTHSFFSVISIAFSIIHAVSFSCQMLIVGSCSFSYQFSLSQSVFQNLCMYFYMYQLKLISTCLYQFEFLLMQKTVVRPFFNLPYRACTPAAYCKVKVAL